MTHIRRRGAALLSFACLLATAACAGQSTTQPVPAAAPPASIPPLPIQRYTFTVSEVADANLARFTAAAQCLRAFGITFDPPAAGPERVAIDIEMLSRRYGITDPVVAATRGYHPPTGFDATGSRLLTEGMSTPEQVVFSGSRAAGDPSVYNGQTIPPGGCDGQAVAGIAQGAEFAHANLAARIQSTGFTRSLDDPRVVAAFAGWSACMAKAGYRYPTPLAATGDTRWDATEPSPDELAAAHTDLACKSATNLVSTWYEVESELENTQIAAHQAELDRIKAQHDAQLARIDSILGR